MIRLAILIGGEMNRLLLLVVIIGLRLQSQMSPRNGLTGGGVDHHKPLLIIGKPLAHDIDVAHMQQGTLRLHVAIVGGSLHDIHANGQSPDDERIGVLLPGRLSHIAFHQRLHGSGTSFFLQHRPSRPVRWD